MRMQSSSTRVQSLLLFSDGLLSQTHFQLLMLFHSGIYDTCTVLSHHPLSSTTLSPIDWPFSQTCQSNNRFPCRDLITLLVRKKRGNERETSFSSSSPNTHIQNCETADGIESLVQLTYTQHTSTHSVGKSEWMAKEKGHTQGTRCTFVYFCRRTPLFLQ